MAEKDDKMKEATDEELTPEQLEAGYERYIERTRDDMEIACRIFKPSVVAETFLALAVDLLMSIGGPQYVKEILAKITKALDVDPEASVN